MAIEERLRVMRWGDEVAICLGDELVFEIAPGADPDVAEKLARSFLPTLPSEDAPEAEEAATKVDTLNDEQWAQAMRSFARSLNTCPACKQESLDQRGACTTSVCDEAGKDSP